jgi:hypothetical protein
MGFEVSTHRFNLHAQFRVLFQKAEVMDHVMIDGPLAFIVHNGRFYVVKPSSTQI